MLRNRNGSLGKKLFAATFMLRIALITYIIYFGSSILRDHSSSSANFFLSNCVNYRSSHVIVLIFCRLMVTLAQCLDWASHRSLEVR